MLAMFVWTVGDAVGLGMVAVFVGVFVLGFVYVMAMSAVEGIGARWRKWRNGGAK